VRPDAVIFDVDGVLVDVRGSFLEGVKRTVQRLVVEHTGARDDGPLVDDELIATFKRAGGFNNDWDLAHALTLWYVEAAPAASTAELRRRAGEPAAAARVSLRARATRSPSPAYDEVKGLMLELYWGSAEAARRFGVRPRLDVREPLLAAERVLLRAETVDALRALGIARFGVLTGRVRAEWDAIRARVPLPADVAVATDEDGRKPDPRVLRALVERLGASRPCYVGDVMDDWRLVATYNERFPASPASAVLVASEGRSELALREAGASAFVRDVNDLPVLFAARPYPPTV
jgi:HAD superfamily hydrolase (TIGR01548 family)